MTWEPRNKTDDDDAKLSDDDDDEKEPGDKDDDDLKKDDKDADTPSEYLSRFLGNFLWVALACSNNNGSQIKLEIT